MELPLFHVTMPPLRRKDLPHSLRYHLAGLDLQHLPRAAKTPGSVRLASDTGATTAAGCAYTRPAPRDLTLSHTHGESHLSDVIFFCFVLIIELLL